MHDWKYTAAERRTIEAAYSAIEYVADHMGHSQPHALREAIRHERRERRSVTTAKALLVAGFIRGRVDNPPAADLACHSAGIITATIIGADSRRFDRPADVLEKLAALATAAAQAQADYIDRNARAAREEIAAAQ
jgi:hypothetical protein